MHAALATLTALTSLAALSSLAAGAVCGDAEDAVNARSRRAPRAMAKPPDGAAANLILSSDYYCSPSCEQMYANMDCAVPESSMA
jgi:hypothetical protein